MTWICRAIVHVLVLNIVKPSSYIHPFLYLSYVYLALIVLHIEQITSTLAAYRLEGHIFYR